MVSLGWRTLPSIDQALQIKSHRFTLVWVQHFVTLLDLSCRFNAKFNILQWYLSIFANRSLVRGHSLHAIVNWDIWFLSIPYLFGCPLVLLVVAVLVERPTSLGASQLRTHCEAQWRAGAVKRGRQVPPASLSVCIHCLLVSDHGALTQHPFHQLELASLVGISTRMFSYLYLLPFLDCQWLHPFHLLSFIWTTPFVIYSITYGKVELLRAAASSAKRIAGPSTRQPFVPFHHLLHSLLYCSYISSAQAITHLPSLRMHHFQWLAIGDLVDLLAPHPWWHATAWEWGQCEPVQCKMHLMSTWCSSHSGLGTRWPSWPR